jgi:hypothetical protein
MVRFGRPRGKNTHGLSRDTGGDDNDLRSLKSLLKTVILRAVSSDLCKATCQSKRAKHTCRCREETKPDTYLGVGVDVAVEQ